MRPTDGAFISEKEIQASLQLREKARDWPRFEVGEVITLKGHRFRIHKIKQARKEIWLRPVVAERSE